MTARAYPTQQQMAVAWACEAIRLAGWVLAADPHNVAGWEVSKGGTTLVVSDWRDLCEFAREVQA